MYPCANIEGIQRDMRLYIFAIFTNQDLNEDSFPDYWTYVLTRKLIGFELKIMTLDPAPDMIMIDDNGHVFVKYPVIKYNNMVFLFL